MNRWTILPVVLCALPHSILGQNCVGDLNDDMVVNVQDVLLLFSHFGNSCSSDEIFDAQVQISEIHYNPSSDQGDDSDWEFIELFNYEEATVSLFNWSFTEGVACTFDETDSIPGLGYFVLARHVDTLLTAMPFGANYRQWNANVGLNNNGETLVLSRPDGSIADEVSYEDNDGWVTPPDGMGPSLELMDPGLPNHEESSWSASLLIGGTPARPNSMWGLSDPE